MGGWRAFWLAFCLAGYYPASATTPADAGIPSCASRFVSPKGFTLKGYLHYSVTDRAHRALAGDLQVEAGYLIFFPLMNEPIFLAQGEPPVFEPGVAVNVARNRIVLTEQLSERE